MNFQDVVSGEMGITALAGNLVAMPLNHLLGSGFPDLRVEGVELSVRSRNERSVATLEQVRSSRTRSSRVITSRSLVSCECPAGKR